MMKNNKLLIFLMSIAMVFLLTGCFGDSGENVSEVEDEVEDIGGDNDSSEDDSDNDSSGDDSDKEEVTEVTEVHTYDFEGMTNNDLTNTFETEGYVVTGSQAFNGLRIGSSSNTGSIQENYTQGRVSEVVITGFSWTKSTELEVVCGTGETKTVVLNTLPAGTDTSGGSNTLPNADVQTVAFDNECNEEIKLETNSSESDKRVVLYSLELTYTTGGTPPVDGDNDDNGNDDDNDNGNDSDNDSDNDNDNGNENDDDGIVEGDWSCTNLCSTYYAGTQGLFSEASSDELGSIIFASVPNYDHARDVLQDSDEDPNNPNNIILAYTRQSVSSTWDSGKTWNREHVFTQSGGASAFKGDIHNLLPTDPGENSRRGSLDFGESGSGVYVPPAEVRGDVARILMYVEVRHNQAIEQHITRDLLMKWHREDPVSEYEINRNNVIHDSIQGNRNPFIDNPQWAEFIFA